VDSVAPDILVKWLRAAGEPSRLRLLMLCSQAALSASDLAHALGQSEPRVSRHLKILCEAGLTERRRQGQWVHYRVAENTPATSFVRGVLAQADRRDPQLLHDRSSAREAASSSALLTHGIESRLGRALAAFVTTADAQAAHGTALVVGAAHPELLESAARAFTQLTVLVSSRRAGQAAQAFAQRRGFVCRVLKTSGPGSAADLAGSGASFDAVMLDHPPSGGEALAHTLQDVRGLLAPSGRVWIFEPYDSLEASRGRIVEHPLARLRRLLDTAGLVCERLSPIEADGEHVLGALARAAAVPQAARTAGAVS
jgi:DNA-binding transcriptional ArsR family regulator